MKRHGPKLIVFTTILGACLTQGLYLNVTSLTGRNNISVLECWQLSTPFESSNIPGVTGSQMLNLGNATNTTYTVLPPRFEGGLHHAPLNQYVWFISGLARIRLPNGTRDEVWVYGGRYGLIYAEDTPETSRWGHDTGYPGADETVAMAIPTEGGLTPEHRVLHEGGCQMWELMGV